MRKTLVLVVALTALMAACSKSATPSSQPSMIPVESVGATPTSVASPSEEPTATKIGDCVIEKKTSCPGADLKDANLHDAELAGANLKGADLSGADLRRANLRGADLRSANLLGATLDSAHLDYARLENANLAGTNLAYANLSNARTNGANTTGTHYCNTIMPDGTKNDAGCPGGSTGSPMPSATPASPVAGGPVIASLSTQKKVDCLKHGSQSKTVLVDYRLRNATSWVIWVDGKSTGLSGTTHAASYSAGENVTIKCNAPSHQITMKASNGVGSVEKSVYVETGI